MSEEEVEANAYEGIMPDDRVVCFDISSEGLDVLEHRIIGITAVSGQQQRIFAERDEKELIKKFWRYLEYEKFLVVVGFNSANFDLPILIVRSIKNGVEIPKLNIKWVDLRQVIFGKSEYRKGTLNDFAKMMGMVFPENSYQKMHMSLLWDEEISLPRLREFLLRDAKITWKLYRHVKEARLI